MGRPWRLSGIEVEASAKTEVVGAIGGIRHAFTTRTGVRRNDDHAVLGRGALRPGLGYEVFVRAGQPGQPVQHGQAAVLGLFGQIDRKAHGAVDAFGGMFEAQLPTAKAAVFRQGLQGTHDQS